MPLILKAKKGAQLAIYYNWSCGDGCCSERAREEENEHFSYGSIVEIEPAKHTWDGVEPDGFWVDSEKWKIVELPAGYTTKRQGCYLIVSRRGGR